MKITRRKLIWFEEMWGLIEKRATFVTDYIGRVQIPSVHDEHLVSTEVSEHPKYPGMTTVKKYVRGSDNFLQFPTELLYSDEALVRYREDKEAGEQRRQVQHREAKEKEQLHQLRLLLEKYPEYAEGLLEARKETIQGCACLFGNMECTIHPNKRTTQ